MTLLPLLLLHLLSLFLLLLQLLLPLLITTTSTTTTTTTTTAAADTTSTTATTVCVGEVVEVVVTTIVAVVSATSTVSATAACYREVRHDTYLTDGPSGGAAGVPPPGHTSGSPLVHPHHGRAGRSAPASGRRVPLWRRARPPACRRGCHCHQCSQTWRPPCGLMADSGGGWSASPPHGHREEVRRDDPPRPPTDRCWGQHGAGHRTGRESGHCNMYGRQ